MPRQRGEAETPTSNQLPRVNRGRRPFGAHGAPNLTLGFAAKPSPHALWAQGLLSVFWERGSPDLPACGLRHGSSGGPMQPSFIAQAQDPREGPSLAGRTAQGFLKNGLARKARKEAERSRQGTSRGAHDASHDDRDQAGARRAPACAVSSFPLWCKRGKHGRGVPRHQAKVAISVQQDQDQQRGRTEVTVEPKTVSSPVLLAAEDQL